MVEVSCALTLLSFTFSSFITISAIIIGYNILFYFPLKQNGELTFYNVYT